MIPKENVLLELNVEYEKMRAVLSFQNGVESKKRIQFIDDLKSRVEEIVNSGGNLNSKKELRNLCKKISEAQKNLINGTDGLEKLGKNIDGIRTRVRQKLAAAVGWEEEKLLDNSGKPTATCLAKINSARTLLGLETYVKVADDTFITPEEIRAYAALAFELGEVAQAEFMAIIKPEKFAFNNRVINNLRAALGQFETFKGNGGLEDIPPELLTLPACAHLRQLLFNNYRDRFYLIYKKSGIEGIKDKVTEMRNTCSGEPRRDFIVKNALDVTNLDV